jgi:hypothetical protein
MTLVLCRECRAEVSDRAVHCPRCGYPVAGDSPRLLPSGHEPPQLPTIVSRPFAVGWTVASGVSAMFMFMLGRGAGAGAAATFGALAILASAIPVWWKTRSAGHAAALSANLERRLEERLQAAEEQIGRRLAEMEDGSRQVAELEERVDFAERLLARYRDDPAKNP